MIPRGVQVLVVERGTGKPVDERSTAGAIVSNAPEYANFKGVWTAKCFCCPTPARCTPGTSSSRRACLTRYPTAYLGDAPKAAPRCRRVH